MAALKIELTSKDAMIVEAKQTIKADMDKVVSRLKKQLADVEAEKDEAFEKAAAVAEDSVSRAEVKKLEKEIKKKDARIKKLEDVKLTKEQVLALKKMKSERLQYLSERDELKVENERLRAAAATTGNTTDKENAGVSTRSTRSSAAASAAADAQLREEKEALEKKLSKYVRHTQSLEEAQAEIIDTLKTLGDAEIAADVEKDVAGAVIALTEKLRACDDEIEELSEAAQSSQQHLVELQRVKEEKAKLERSLKRANGDGGRVAELEETISALEEERAELQELARNAKASSNSVVEEQSRQVRYLEQEALNLHQEMKTLRKELAAAKAKVASMSSAPEGSVAAGGAVSSIGGDDTIDLGGISSSRMMQQMLSDATNSQQVPSSPAAKASKRSFASSVRKSVKKAARVGRTPGKKPTKPTLGSGIGEGTDDATSECNQS